MNSSNIKRLLIKALDKLEITFVVILFTAILFNGYKNPQIGIEILMTSLFIICLAVSISLPANKVRKN